MLRPAHRLLSLAALAACGQAPCPEGSFRAATGLCTLHAEPTDTSTPTLPSADGTQGVPDTGASVEWLALPSECAAPDRLGRAPVTLVGELELQRHAFVELVDLVVNTERGLAFGAGHGGLVIADISDPVTPRFVAAAWPTGGPERFYRVAEGPENHVYTTHRDTGLVVWDTTNPERPEVTHTVSEADFSGMDVQEDLLYLVTHAGQLVTYDLSTPGVPVEVHRTGGLANGWQPTVVGDWLYVADNTNGVVVFSLSDPRAPRFARAIQASGGVQELAASDDETTLYAAVGGAGIEVFGLANPGRPSSVGVTNLHTSAISLDVSGDILWAATQQDVVALDLARATEPRLVGTFQTRQWAMHVAATSEGAWVGDWGWVESYAVDKLLEVPDAELANDDFFVDSTGDVTEVRVANLGATPLVLEGFAAGDPRVTAEVSRASIASGESGRLRLRYTGGGALDTELCLQTNDPDEPVFRMRIRDGESGIDRDYLGTAAPDFDLEDLSGTPHRLSDQRGHPVVLVYFATW